jgi:hypothetical protein
MRLRPRPDFPEQGTIKAGSPEIVQQTGDLILADSRLIVA